MLVLCTKCHWTAVIFPVRMFALQYVCVELSGFWHFPFTHCVDGEATLISNENVFKTVRPLCPGRYGLSFFSPSPLSLPYFQSENLGNPLPVCSAGNWTQSLVSARQIPTHWARARVCPNFSPCFCVNKSYCDRFLALGVPVVAAGHAQCAEPRQVCAPCA